MAKKTAPKQPRRQAKGKATTKARSTGRALVPSFLAVLTRVKINKQGPAHPDKVTSFQTGPMVWLIFNRSGADQTLTIDPKKFVNTVTNRPDNPLTADTPLSASIPDGGRKVIIGVIRDDASQVPYRYEIATLNEVTRLERAIDPDLDVVDPHP
jgi:hypothetical protein